MSGPQARWLHDGRRLHLNHGPIDLVVEAFGDPEERRAAYAQAVARFATVLGELVEELPELRRRAGEEPRAFAGPVARRMEHAVVSLAARFITPMAAVAGSVADEVLAAMLAGRRLAKAYVNNGGDIALHLAGGAEITLAVAGAGSGAPGENRAALPEDRFGPRIAIRASDPVRGVATSGWRGRSFSLGIADAVTVLARDGAAADAAATLIANAVDLPRHPAVSRRPALELAPDSDLGARLVTVNVGPLSPKEVAAALASGLAVAQEFRAGGFIEAAALFLAGESRVCGAIDSRGSVAARPLALGDAA